ncbi:MAG: hypothetical protein IKV90_03845 [Clostridia bacterium]|nr:hypothetical protein [Clostridia bacterium]
MKGYLKKRGWLLMAAMLMIALAAPALSQNAAYDDLVLACADVRAAVYERKTETAFFLSETGVAGRSKAVIRDLITDVLEGYQRYSIGMEERNGGMDITIEGDLRPSLKILDAWETGDRSQLTQSENACMDAALEIVDRCRAGAKSALEIERRLYDAICGHAAYELGPGMAHYGSEEYLYVTTCIGGILGGKAQCLGYSEVFYLLAKLAGLDVSMQYGYAGGDLGSAKHAWNVVRLGGKNYMVDVCWGDTSGDSFAPDTPDYRYFNVGLDCMPEGRHPSPEAQIAQISETTDLALTAFGGVGPGVICKDLSEALDYVINGHHEGREYAHIFIPEAKITTKDVDPQMNERRSQAGIKTKWGRLAHELGNGTYLIFRWVFE